jgi:two-component system phosphate regulon sensor histidine kinase PhoR
LNAGETWRGELVNLRKDGSMYDAAVTIAPINDEAGRPVNFVGVQVDISALKELDRMKSQFVSDVSHELRTPLTNIRLYLDLLGSTEDPGRLPRYLETLGRESERLTNLIDDLLSLSRLEAGTMAFNPVPIDLNGILRGLVEDRRALAASRGLHLEIETEPNVSEVLGDERLLSQVFTNLLTNAMNYTPDGGKITLRSGMRTLLNVPWVVVQVADTGMGIAPEEQALLFRRFFRGQASRAAKSPGTGLGLAICKEIIDRHGGRVSVESEGRAGAGSVFSVWLRPMSEAK